jgi:aspergillopepsin I
MPAADQAGPPAHTVYDASKSSTFKSLSGYTWDISYADGSGANGVVGTDTVKLGSATVTSQAVEQATSASASFVTGDSDGLLGLAFSTINTVTPKQQLTFYDNIKSTLATPVFTADLKHQAPGTYTFGSIDTTKYTGDLFYVSVDSSNGFWEFTATGYQIGTAAAKTESVDAIADTGTTLLIISDDIAAAYYAAVDGAYYDVTQGGYVFDCSATLPDFTAIIGSYKAVIPGKYVNFAPIGPGSVLPGLLTPSDACFGGIQGNQGSGMSIFGDIFFKGQFVVFDSGTTPSKPRLGFAAKPSP